MILQIQVGAELLSALCVNFKAYFASLKIQELHYLEKYIPTILKGLIVNLDGRQADEGNNVIP